MKLYRQVKHDKSNDIYYIKVKDRQVLYNEYFVLNGIVYQLLTIDDARHLDDNTMQHLWNLDPKFGSLKKVVNNWCAVDIVSPKQFKNKNNNG